MCKMLFMPVTGIWAKKKCGVKTGGRVRYGRGGETSNEHVFTYGKPDKVVFAAILCTHTHSTQKNISENISERLKTCNE